MGSLYTCHVIHDPFYQEWDTCTDFKKNQKDFFILTA